MPRRFVLDSALIPDSVIEYLKSAAQPAPFGRDRETVLDPAYRNALQLPVEAFGLNTVLPTGCMLSEIATLMQPGEPQIYAELDKINIYGPGGMFKAHVDTPRSNWHFGSLVVALPSAFQGGELVIRHAGSTATLALQPTAPPAPATKDKDTGPVIEFAAFFSDCEHEVLPVTAGYRVTITYMLMLKDTSSPSLSKVSPRLSGASVPLVAKLQQLIKSESWHPEGVTVGYILQHKYATELDSINEEVFPSVLKGADRLLYAALRDEMGLTGKFLPVHLKDYDDADERSADEGEEEKGTTEDACFAASPDMMNRMLVGRDMVDDAWDIQCMGTMNDDEDTLSSQLNERFTPAGELENVLWAGLRDDESIFPLRSAIPCYGNALSLDYMYSGIALFVDIPAWGTTGRGSAA